MDLPLPPVLILIWSGGGGHGSRCMLLLQFALTCVDVGGMLTFAPCALSFVLCTLTFAHCGGCTYQLVRLLYLHT